ncbi:MAG TPA: PhzF family phenazine biosynthesis protein [Rudaea sp.]|jgi:PhzF family phenazine biosynthesis protein|uniref:PhzF family phenazine biosynthesis protein n=1 Tax=Rudaea sp. TaxID=2136325 RepID=UPI002F92AB72
MSSLRYLQVDVFAERAGGGNPLGVVFGADAWSDQDMQRFAAWTNLVETTFVLAPAEQAASYRLRIFTPAKEIPFAGHPTIGSAHAALEIGHVAPRDGLLIQECAAGLLPIRVEGEAAARQLYVQAPAARILREGADDPLLRTVIGDAPLGVLPPAFVEGGRRWWLAEFASESALRAWRPDHAAIAALARAGDSLGLCCFARAHAHEEKSSARSAARDCQLVVRAFPAGVGIVEDPASGAANGLIAAYIAQREPQGALARGYRVSQGREMGHDATIDIRIEADGAVWVGGRSHTIIDGRVLQRIAVG